MTTPVVILYWVLKHPLVNGINLISNIGGFFTFRSDNLMLVKEGEKWNLRLEELFGSCLLSCWGNMNPDEICLFYDAD